MVNLCKYKDIFGKPGQGVHSYRIANIAIVDVLFTLIGAYLINRYFFNKKHLIKTTLILFILGIIFHRLFCVKTTINNLIFKME